MSFSLDSLKPKVTDVKINAYGDEIVIPIMPLTYTEYHNVEIGLERPDKNQYTVRKLNASGKHEETHNPDDPDYIKAMNDYFHELRLRRLAIALERGGAKELQSIELDKQVAMVREMDSGIAEALMRHLEREAKHRIAATFQPLSGDGS